ncbi:hypothetical protein Pmani_029941 [Petrolisthes manimaculis]|uniref:Cytochrome b5 heme-binding domain-containing protein n=1 Tax=Petrolisthes manimaculis TaxID=1843537 RepID=A0AAE1NXT2_9EUCA|nr:hypothetical protein Pmani_029941 [Petrolisthes manimaculis]
MKDNNYGTAPLYLLQPSSIFTFAAQTLELATQTLGYRDTNNTSSSTSTTNSSFSDDDSTSTRHRKRDEQSGLDVYTLDEVARHDTMNDCWIILYDKVFDVTKFLLDHPGGEDVMLEHAGRDATIAFRGVGHSLPALQALDTYLMGILPPEERVFTGEGPCQWSTL